MAKEISTTRYAAPVFSAEEQVFLRCYAKSLDRVQAMADSLLGYTLGLSPRDTHALELAATSVIRKAESLPIEQLATAIGADKIAMVRRIWDICQHQEGHIAIKGLGILAKIHGVYDAHRGIGSGSIALVLGTPEAPKVVTPQGLGFTLEPDA